jgi:hypothetical protein
MKCKRSLSLFKEQTSSDGDKSSIPSVFSDEINLGIA